MNNYSWARSGGYEVSSKGDARFSAMNARLQDGRTIEAHYQCDLKNYDPGGERWWLGKGKPAKDPHLTYEQQWEGYLGLWREFFRLYPNYLLVLRDTLAEKGTTVLTDRFASGVINQARAIAEILNETDFDSLEYIAYIKVVNSYHQKQWPDPRVVFCGRGSPVGNPFPMKDKDDRDRVCDLYETHFKKQVDTNDEMILSMGYLLSQARKGVLYLRCFCAPKRCHTDTIRNYLNDRLAAEGYTLVKEDPSIREKANDDCRNQTEPQ